jgi:hypothetical protein
MAHEPTSVSKVLGDPVEPGCPILNIDTVVLHAAGTMYLDLFRIIWDPLSHLKRIIDMPVEDTLAARTQTVFE